MANPLETTLGLKLDGKALQQSAAHLKDLQKVLRGFGGAVESARASLDDTSDSFEAQNAALQEMEQAYKDWVGAMTRAGTSQSKMGDSTDRLQKAFQELRTQGVSRIPRELTVLEKALTGLNKNGLGQMQKELRRASAAARAENFFKQLQESAEETEQTLQRFGNVFDNMRGRGDAILNMAGGMAQQYTEAYGSMELAGATLLKQQQTMAVQQTRLGRVAAQALAPYREMQVGLLASLTSFIEKNPWIVQAGVGAGAALAAAAAVGGTIVQVTSLINKIGPVISAMRTMPAMSTLGRVGAYGAVGAAAVAAGTVGGIGAVRAIGHMTDDERLQNYTFGDALQQAANLAIQGLQILGLALNRAVEEIEKAVIGVREWLGKMPFGASVGGISSSEASRMRDDTSTRFADARDNYMRLTENLRNLRLPNLGLGGAAPAQQYGMNDFMTEDRVGGLRDFMIERAKAERDHQREMLVAQKQFQRDSELALRDYQRTQYEAERDFNYERQMAAEEYQRSLIDMERQYNFDRSDALEELRYSQGEAERQFNIERGDALRDHLYERSRAEEEFQYSEMLRLEQYNRDRARAERDHRYEIIDSAASLDAAAVLQSQRNYIREQRQAEYEYGLETMMNKRQFDREAMLAEREFARQEELALINYERQYIESERQFARQEELAERQYNRQLAEAERQFNLQESLAQRAYDRQLALAQERFEYDRRIAEEAYNYERQRAQEEFAYRQQIEAQDYANRLRMEYAYQSASAEQQSAYWTQLRNQMAAILGGADIPSGGLTAIQGQTGFGANPTPTGEGSVYRSPTGLTANRVVKTSRVGGGDRVADSNRRRSYAEGGYTGAGGLAMLHPNEFVLTAGTTSALERQMGGTLTQGRLAAAGAGGAGGVNFDVNVAITGVEQRTAQDIAAQIERTIDAKWRQYMTWLKGN